jgi:hypothetical protein
MELKLRQRRISISTRDTRDREVMTGSKRPLFGGSLRAKGVTRQKSPIDRKPV